MNYIYGPVPSRRLGISLGVSPIPKKTCNYSCVYCQLGRTNHMTNTRKSFFDVKDIISELECFIQTHEAFDVVTIVGEGEPTLYLDLKELIIGIKKKVYKPVAVITNGALLYDRDVRDALNQADIVLPTFDAYDQSSFKAINRPHGSLSFEKVYQGLIDFSKQYKGQLWIEMMFVKNMNDSFEAIKKYKTLLQLIRYDKIYINTPVRPPAEDYVKSLSHQRIKEISDALNGISIDLLTSEGFYSDIEDHIESIKSIIKRHPMNQYEINGFLQSRNCNDIKNVFSQLKIDPTIEIITYQTYDTYRLK